MLRRLALATLCGLCLSGVTYAQRVASRDATTSERQRTENDVRAAGERYGRARESGNQAEMREAGKALRDAFDAYDAARGGKSASDDFDFKDQPISREFDRMKDWDRRMGGSDRGGPQHESPGRSRDRDKADRSSGSDRSSDRGGSQRDSGGQRDADRDRDTNKGKDNKP